MVKSVGLGAVVGLLLVLTGPRLADDVALHAQTTAVGGATQVPEYVWDPTWPKNRLTLVY